RRRRAIPLGTAGTDSRNRRGRGAGAARPGGVSRRFLHARHPATRSMSARTLTQRAIAAVTAPQPIVRLEIIRILAPLAILGFMASRVAHTGDWLSSDGFRVPPLDDDWRQPATLPGLPPALAILVCIALVGSGLATAAGAFTRVASAVFAATLVYVALADR